MSASALRLAPLALFLSFSATATVHAQDRDEQRARPLPVRISAAPLLLRYRAVRPLETVPLFGSYFEGFRDLALPVHPEDSDWSDEDRDEGEVRWPMSEDRLVELIRHSVQPMVWEEDGQIGCRHKDLVVLAPKVTQGAVERMVQGLINTVAPSLDVEVSVFKDARPDAGFERRSLTAARERLGEVAKRPGDLLYQGRMRVRPGETLQLGRLRQDVLQRGFEGEVAAKTGMVRKKRMPIRVGLGVDLELQLLPDARTMAVFGTFADRDLELSEQPSPLTGFGIDEYEPALLDEQVRTFAALLPGNGAFELPLGRGLRLLVSVEKQASRAGEVGELEVWPHGFLTRRLQVDVAGPEVEEDLSESFGTTPMDPDELSEMISTAVPELEEALGASVEVDSRHLYMRAPPELIQRGQAALVDAVAERARAFEISIGREQRGPERGANWQPVEAPIVLVTLARRTARLVTGRSTSYVADGELMIAEDSSLQVPRLRACFAGLCGQLAVLPKDKECDLVLHLGWQELQGWRSIKADVDGAYETRVPLVERRSVAHVLHMRLGERIPLGAGPRIKTSAGGLAETRFWIQVRELGKD